MRGGAEREVIATDVVAVRPFGDADELLLVWGKKYRLENPDQVLIRLKVEHSGFGTLNNQRFGLKFFEEAIPFRRRDKVNGQEVESKPHIPRLLRE